MSIHVLKAQGLSQREISRRLGISRNTVSRYLALPETPRYKPREARPTKLEPFHAYIVQRMQAAEPEQIAAPALLRELKAQGVIRANYAVFRRSCSYTAQHRHQTPL